MVPWRSEAIKARAEAGVCRVPPSGGPAPSARYRYRVVDAVVSAEPVADARSGRLRAVWEFALPRRSLACGNGTLVVAGPAGRWMGAA